MPFLFTFWHPYDVLHLFKVKNLARITYSESPSLDLTPGKLVPEPVPPTPALYLGTVGRSEQLLLLHNFISTRESGYVNSLILPNLAKAYNLNKKRVHLLSRDIKKNIISLGFLLSSVIFRFHSVLS